MRNPWTTSRLRRPPRLCFSNDIGIQSAGLLNGPLVYSLQPWEIYRVPLLPFQLLAILGSRQFALRAWLDPQRMAAYSITASDVRTALANNNYLAALGTTKGQMVSVDLRCGQETLARIEVLPNAAAVAGSRRGQCAAMTVAQRRNRSAGEGWLASGQFFRNSHGAWTGALDVFEEDEPAPTSDELTVHVDF